MIFTKNLQNNCVKNVDTDRNVSLTHFLIFCLTFELYPKNYEQISKSRKFSQFHLPASYRSNFFKNDSNL